MGKGDVMEERQLLVEEAETHISLQMRPGNLLSFSVLVGISYA